MALTPEQITALRTLANQVIKIGAANGWVTTEKHNPLEQAIIDAIEAHAFDQNAHGAASLPAGAKGSILYHNGTAWAVLPKGDNGQLLKLALDLPTWESPSNQVFSLMTRDGHCYLEYFNNGTSIQLRLNIKNVVLTDMLTGKFMYLSHLNNTEFTWPIENNIVFQISAFVAGAGGGNLPIVNSPNITDQGWPVLLSAKSATTNTAKDLSGLLAELANQYQLGNVDYDTYTSAGNSVTVNAHRFIGTERRIRIITAENTTVGTTITPAARGNGYIILTNTHTEAVTVTFADCFEAKAIQIPAESEVIVYFYYNNTAIFKLIEFKSPAQLPALTTGKIWQGGEGNVPQEVDLPNEAISIAISDEATALTTGTAKVTYRMPYAATLTGVRANVNTAPTGAILIVDVNKNGTSILSTKVSIDAGEETSVTASTPSVISTTALEDDCELTFDIDQVGATEAGKGLKITLIVQR